MDEKHLQEWSEALAELRENRSNAIDEALKQKPEFSPKEFYDIATSSLDAVLERWLDFEKRSPAKPEAMKAELDSVHEFELDAIARDISVVRESRVWDAEAVSAAETPFGVMADQLKQKYVLKLSAPAAGAAALSKTGRKNAPAEAPARYGAGPSSGGSGMGMALMFFVGLALGAGPSFYFWDAARKQGAQAETEKTKLATEKRSLEDSMALIHGRFDQLASGELKSLPEIEKMEEKIRKEADEKKKAVVDTYGKERERLKKKLPAGDRLDEALAANDEKRNSELAEIEAASAQAVEPFEKQKTTLQEIRAR